MRKLLAALAALLPILVAMPEQAGAAAGGHMNRDCAASPMDLSPYNIKPQSEFSFCPSTTATLTTVIRVESMADCNWDGDPDSATYAGGVTLAVTKCSGSTATSCDTPMTDSSSVAWVVTSDDEDGRFSVTSGIYLITASATSATGRLLCTGR